MARNRTFAAALGLTTAIAIAVPTAVAATPSCAWGITPQRPVAVAVRADLTADGEIADVSRAVSGTDHCWAATAAPEAADLPVDVAVLYTDADGRSLEASELTDASGPVTVRVAVRDRTAADQLIAVAGPLVTEHVVERVGLPQVVEVGIELPSGWEDLQPATPGARVDVSHTGLRVRHAALLFPPVTSDEIVVELTVRPGAGVPTVTVESTPAGQDLDGALEDSLDRETAAVLAA
ncbi:MAG: hypothetical protein R3249_05095, partial [Nitriliruptorales bacterium]|nr:hypothetical protein [Nitriliruptorales bacterium]